MPNEGYDAEFTVIRKGSRRLRVLRSLLFLCYILFSLLYWGVFLFLVKLPQVIALWPIFVWILVFYTWRYLHVEYRTDIVSGRITFTRILINVKKEKTLASLRIADARRIFPAFLLDGKQRRPADTLLDLRGGGEAPDAYCILYDGEDGRSHAVIFRATRKMLRLFLLYNPRGTVESDNLIY